MIPPKNTISYHHEKRTKFAYFQETRNARRRRVAHRHQPDSVSIGWPWSFLYSPRRVVICAAFLQEWLGLTTKDAVFSAVWLTRDKFGLTFLDQLGSVDLMDLLSSRRASRRSAQRYLRVCVFNFGHTLQ